MKVNLELLQLNSKIEEIVTRKAICKSYFVDKTSKLVDRIDELTVKWRQEIQKNEEILTNG